MGFCVGVALAFQVAFNPAMHWKVKPEVVICHSSDVSVTRASRAVSYWTHRGYTFGEIRKATRDYMPCVTGQPNYGEIIINNEKMNQYPIYTRTKKFKISLVPQIGGFFSDLTIQYFSILDLSMRKYYFCLLCSIAGNDYIYYCQP